MPAAAEKRGRAQGLATPTTTDPPPRHAGHVGVFCTAEFLRGPFCLSIPPGATRRGVLSAGLRSLRPAELRRVGGTNVFWLRRHLRFSCVQFTRLGVREQGKLPWQA